MFEFSFIKQYLTPRRKQLSVSLIALLSIVVITLVVWLVVVFLSITEGIEKNWIKKLTTLNAPLRLQPTNEYFHSYYYNIDRYSAASHYMSKTIGQKAKALLSNPYNPDFDESLPPSVKRPEYNQKGELLDPVKELLLILRQLEISVPGLRFQDMEMCGALLRLNLIRQERGELHPMEMQSQLTSVSYLASFPERNPFLDELLLHPTEEDLNHLIFLASRSQDSQKFQSLLAHSKIEKLTTQLDLWRIPLDFLPEKTPFHVIVYTHRGDISHLLLPVDSSMKGTLATLEKKEGRFFYKGIDQVEVPLDQEIPLFIQGKLDFLVKETQGLSFVVEATLQKHSIMATLSSLEGLKVAKASFTTRLKSASTTSPPWSFYSPNGIPILPHTQKISGILIAKNFRENGIHIGDEGFLSYSSPSLSGPKQMQIPVYIAGFYDPGIMAVGNKCILVPPSITEMINASESAFTLEKSESNQFFVWFPKLSQVKEVKQNLLEKLQEKGIEKYWKIETYKEYEFAKDLMQQFQSDKYLFTMIAILILLVACTNIISLLVLLVTDKKKEIGILCAMGAKRRSIAAIFAFSGASLGFLSCLLGLFLAFLTLKNIDSVVKFLSLIQGHEAFNAQFFGTSLPHEMSAKALLFVAITTPLLALLAGLFPAIKAARLNPCDTLRSE